MKKPLLKRILVGACALLAVGGVGVGVLWWRVKGEPNWYRKLEDPAEIDRSARVLEDKLQDARNWAAAVTAAERRAERGTLTTSRAPLPSEDITLRLTGNEMTGFLLKWMVLQGWEGAFEQYFQDPVVAVMDGRVVVAGKVKELGTVVSMMFRPELMPDGKMGFQLERVLGGNLPLPANVVGPQLSRLRVPVEEGMSRWQRDARLDSRGQANSAMSLALGGRIVMAMLDGKPTDAVAAVPVDDKSMLVRVVGFGTEKNATGEGEALVVKLRPLEPEKRKAVLAGLK